MKTQVFLPAGSQPRSTALAWHGFSLIIRRIWPILLPICILLPSLASFPYPSAQSSYSDFSISHYPNIYFLRQSLTRYGSVPLWSPAILSGYPFAANPLSGLWYPPGWLALLLPLPIGVNLLILLHLLWGAAGFYLLLRRQRLNPPAGLLGAVAFEAMPKLFAHYGAGHVSLLYAVTWTPWLLLASTKIRITPVGQPRKRFASWALPSIVLALIILSDVRWAAYASLLLWGWVLWQHRLRPVSTSAGITHGGIFKAGSTPGLVLRLMGLTVLSIFLAAPLILPLAEYTQLSTRSSLAPADSMIYSLPPDRLLGILFPDLGGFHEWVLYPGWLVLALGLIAILWPRSRSRAAFWAWTAAICVVFALGDKIPLMPFITRLPLLDLLRVPPRSLFAFGMACAGLGAYGLDALLGGPTADERRRAVLLVVFLGGISLATAGLAGWLTGSLPGGFAWGAAAAAFGAFWIWLALRGRLQANSLWIAGLIGMCLLDLGVVDLSLFAPRPAEQVLSEADETVQYLSAQPGTFRVYSPSYSLPQQNAIRAGLSLADGVDPLQLREYAAYMEAASGIPQAGYSVTLPPFEAGDPAAANAGYLPNPDLLGMLNVRYVAAEFDLNTPGLVLRQRFGRARIYENLHFRPRAWVQPAEQGAAVDYLPVSSLNWAPNRIEIEAPGPGLLVLSEVWYPGWQVRVDGQQQAMQRADTILRGVDLESGDHKVVFTFRPTSLYLGVAMMAVGVMFILLMSLWLLKQGRPGWPRE